tara:strand:+ start:200 stop:454 length:255 start_codon:yes stop_codon:yes gene_type:complete
MTFNEIVQQLNSKYPHYTRVPCEENSSARMGGWLLKDADNMYIGFVSYRGGAQLLEIAETTPDNVPNMRGANDEKYKEFKNKYK